MRIPPSGIQSKPMSIHSIDQILRANNRNDNNNKNNDVQTNNFQSDHEIVLDVENNDNYPLMSDLDAADHDPNDMGRPRKIKR